MDFEHLYRNYYTEVYYYMRSICRDEALCEEIAQETFFKALKKIDSFDGKKDIRAWLFTIAKNTYLSILRKNKHRASLSEEALLRIESQASPEEALDDADAVFRVHTCLHRLAEPYKEVFSLRVFGELDYDSIGRLFHKSAGWARVTYYRAKTMIQKELEDEDGSDQL